MDSLALRVKAQKVETVDKKIRRDNVDDVACNSRNFSERYTGGGESEGMCLAAELVAHVRFSLMLGSALN